jgi:precorrin-2 methylase
MVVEVQLVERLTLVRNQHSLEILIKNIRKPKRKQLVIVVLELVVVPENENYHQLQQQRKYLLKAEHAQLVEVLVVERQKVNPLNLFSFIHLLVYVSVQC